MIERDQTGHANRHFISDENVFAMRKWTSFVQAINGYVDKVTVDEGDSFNLDG